MNLLPYILLVVVAAVAIYWIYPKREPHKADDYFKHKLREPMSDESKKLVRDAYDIRYQYPDLTGPELVRLVYWGASGEKPDDQ